MKQGVFGGWTLPADYKSRCLKLSDEQRDILSSSNHIVAEGLATFGKSSALTDKEKRRRRIFELLVKLGVIEIQHLEDVKEVKDIV